MDMGNPLTGIPENSYQEKNAQIQARWDPSSKWGGRHRLPPLIKKLSETDTHLQMKN